MSKVAELRPLLKHPVLTAFTLLKWQRIQIFFYLNLLFYLTLCLLLTGYIIFTYQAPQNFKDASDNSILELPTKIDYHDKSNFTDVKPQLNQVVPTQYTTIALRGIILLFLSILMLRELFQIVLKPVSYLKDYENHLEVLLLILATFVTVNNCPQISNDTYLKFLCPQFSALVILIAWYELVLLLGKHPRFSVQIEMFRKVSSSFLQFLSWYILLILSFALSFYVLFRGCNEKCSKNNPFLNPLEAIFKTLIMLTGEFEAGDSIPFFSYVGVSHLIFIAFVFLIAIVLLNLLNGLAVADTKVIKDDAYFYSCIARVKLIAFIENILLGDNQSVIRNFYNFCDNVIKCSIFSYFARKIVFFPSFLPDNEIEINVEKNTIECLDVDKSCTKSIFFYIDDQTIRDAREIAEANSERKKSNESGDTLAPRLDNCLCKIDELNRKMLNFEKRFDAIEQANKQIEELLIRNIAIVSLNHSNNEDR